MGMWVGRMVGSKVEGWYPSSSVPEEKEVHPQAMQERMRQTAIAVMSVIRRKKNGNPDFGMCYDRV